MGDTHVFKTKEYVAPISAHGTRAVEHLFQWGCFQGEVILFLAVGLLQWLIRRRLGRRKISSAGCSTEERETRQWQPDKRLGERDEPRPRQERWQGEKEGDKKGKTSSDTSTYRAGALYSRQETSHDGSR